MVASVESKKIHQQTNGAKIGQLDETQKRYAHEQAQEPSTLCDEFCLVMQLFAP
jgi:hypothetical protein